MHEVDHLWVGEKSNTGDAIAMRFTRPDTGTNAVVVIDGGFRETGDRLADHIENYYGTSTVDLAVCTHPDDDHIMGLFTLLERAHVKKLLIHRPKDFGYRSSDGVKSDTVEDLIALAKAQGTEVDHSSFAGVSFFGGALVIAGPTKDYYASLLAVQKALTSSTVAKFAHGTPPFFASMASKVRSLFGDPGETMTGDNGGTTPRNNSSIVMDFQLGDNRALFTGDAGAPALTRAADKLDDLGRSVANIDLFDVPHHGSRHNLTPQLLDRLIGTVTDDRRGWAVASVGKEAHDHPRAEVANAFKRRGYPVCCTRGVNLWWRSEDAPLRWDYNGAVTPLDWLDETDAGAA
ncbi:ComEC/Rec2 family competence protein [Nocardioides dongkuii]|uniref:ComEC/Rec2 family competence protein n=1 Tax=Nocardioides dongkuii TaxID=2760089 RepID=UPI0018777620|nr:MBL fold metallo-hydrolase [Nocardioides dongkuii]